MSCVPFFHSYGKWVDVRESAEGSILVQQRRCTHCGKVQRRQTTWLGGDFDPDGDEILP